MQVFSSPLPFLLKQCCSSLNIFLITSNLLRLVDSQIFLGVYNKIIIEIRSQKMKGDPLSELRNTQQFLKFNDYLKRIRQFGSKKEDINIFYSYYLSKKIQDIVFNVEKQMYTDSTPNLQETLNLILQNQKIKKILDFLKHKSQKFKQKTTKDRKNSFFRTVVKHIRQTQCKQNSSHISTNVVSSQENSALLQIQNKLARNTISSEDIQELLSKHGAQIVDYLKGQKIYNDILTVNKSKRNKAFYILHLKEITIEAMSGRLSEYPFFQNLSFKEQITNIVKTLFDYRWEKKEKKDKIKVDFHKQSTFSSLRNPEEEKGALISIGESIQQLPSSQNDSVDESMMEEQLQEPEDLKKTQVKEEEIFQIKDGSCYFGDP